MAIVPKILRTLLMAVIVIFMTAVFFMLITSITPIYNFREEAPFSGPDIFNPYENIDSSLCWKRANFHTHTRVEGIMNECEKWPGEVLEAYDKFDYDIVTFSNHNKLTAHPTDSSLQVNVYEHGYNLFKYHKLVFGCHQVNRFDHLIPFTASHKQWQIRMLLKDADMIQINHPLRTNTLSDKQMRKLSGYRLTELDSGKSTENRYWDEALSAGRYSFGLANDDLHYPDRSNRIAVRCNFLCTASGRYEDILQTLNTGGFYSMRVPDYGHGDWEVKYEKNKTIPFIKNIGLRDSTIFIELSHPADSIKVIGQDHMTLAMELSSDSLSYTMRPLDPYARITAYFSEGEVIYTNPFARYDSTVSDSPFNDSMPEVNILLTILFNLLILGLCTGEGYIFYKLIQKNGYKRT